MRNEKSLYFNSDNVIYSHNSFYACQQFRKIVETLEENIESRNENNSLDKITSNIDDIKNKVDRLEENLHVSQKYYDIVTENFSEKEFEFLLESFLKYDQVELYIHLESLKIYVHVVGRNLEIQR